MERRLAGLSEEACDDAVLMGGHDPFAYSEFLLGLARAVREAGARVEVVGMAMPGTFLPERIRRIAGGVKVQRISGKRMAGLVVFCGAGAMVCAGAAVGYRAAVQSPPAPVVKAEAPVVSQQATPVVVKQWKTRPSVLMAQAVAPGTSVHGSVFDPANLPVAGALVSMTGANQVLTAFTDDQGSYIFSGFPAGTYSMAVRVPGFKMLAQTGVQVTEGTNVNVGKMMLQVGGVSEAITITGSRSAPVPFIGTLGPMTMIPNSAPAPPPVAVVPSTTGGHVSPVMLVSQTKPVYPVEMQQAGISGTVKMQAVISKEGLVDDLTATSAPDPALARAAMEAVWKWRYRPATLNGQPIEVVSTIDVNYALKD